MTVFSYNLSFSHSSKPKLSYAALTHFEEQFDPKVVTAVLHPWHGPRVPLTAPKADVGSPTSNSSS